MVNSDGINIVTYSNPNLDFLLLDPNFNYIKSHHLSNSIQVAWVGGLKCIN